MTRNISDILSSISGAPPQPSGGGGSIGGIFQQQPGTIPGYGGGGYDMNQLMQNMSDDYSAIVNANNRTLQGLDTGEPLPPREMNQADIFAARSNRVAEKLSGITGFNPEAGMTPDNLVRFAASLPFQMASVVPDTIAHGYEGLTGRPVLEGDLDLNMMPGEDLTPIQRAADLAYSGINIAGTFAGGTGRVLGTAGKVGGKFLGKMNPGTLAGDAAENMASGMLARAGIGGEKAAPYLQLTHDITEEGVEEFAQSYLEDTRFDRLDEGSFGRAVEGAKWGALGGGIMSGGMLGVNRAMKYYSDSGNPANSVQGDPNNPSGQTRQDDNPYAPYTAARYNTTDGNHISATMMQQFKDDQGGKVTERPGSIVATHTVGDTNLGANQGVVGTDQMQGIWEQGEKSQNVLMNWFKVDDRRVLEDIFHGDTRNKARKLNNLLARAYPDGHAEIVVGRNPDTKNGAYRIRVKEFVNGNSLQLNPLAYQIVGSDVDGDTSGLYFDTTGLQALGYVSDMFMDAEGNSNVEYKYSSMVKSDFDGKNGNLDDTIHYIFDRYTRTYGDDNKSAAEYYIEQLRNALTSENSRDGNISKVFTQMQNDIRDMNAKGEYDQALGSLDHIDAMDHFFAETSDNPLQYAQNMANSYRDKFLENYEEALRQLENEHPQLAQRLSAGMLGDIKTPVEMYPYIGMLTSASPRAGNPIYRQYAAIGYNMAKANRAVASSLGNIAREIGVENVFEAAIRESFREAQMGVAPTTAIEGMLDGIIAEYTLAESGFTEMSDKTPRSKEDLEKIQNAFIDSWNHFRGVYNDSLEQLTGMGWEPVYGKPKRNEITSTDDSQFIRSFRKFMGPIEADRFFPAEALTEENANLTVDQLMKKYAEDPTKYRQFMSAYPDPYFQKFFNDLVRNEGSEIHAVESRVIESIKNLDTSGLQARYEANGNKFEHGDVHAAIEVMQMINNWVHVKASQRLRLFDPDDAVKIRLGRNLFFGSTDERTVAIIGANYYGKFVPILEYFAANDTDIDIDEKVLNRLDDLAQIDDVHRRIANEIIDNKGRSLTLERLTSLDDTYETKKLWFKEQFGEDNRTLSLLDSSMKAENDDATTSSIGQRMAVVESAQSRYRAALRDNDFKTLTRIKELNNSYPNSDFAGFMRGRVNAGLCRFSMDILGMELHDAAVVSNPAIEKATVQGSAVHKWSVLQHMNNGGLESYIDGLTSGKNGQITLQNFWNNRNIMMSILADPNFDIEIHDPETGRNVHVDREKVFRWAGFEIGKNEPNGSQWIGLLEKCPQLCGWLTVSEVQTSTVNGAPKQGWSQAESLDDGFVRWNNETMDSTGDRNKLVDRQMREGTLQTGNWLLNQSWYFPSLVRCISDEDLQNCLVDPYHATKVLTKLHDRFSKGAYAGALLRNNGVDIKDDKEFHGTVGALRANMARQNVTDLFNSVNNAFQLNLVQAAGQMGLTLKERQALKESYDVMVFKTNAMNLLGNIDELKGLNLDLPNSSELKTSNADQFNTLLAEQSSAMMRLINLMNFTMGEYTSGRLTNSAVSEDVIDEAVAEAEQQLTKPDEYSAEEWHDHLKYLFESVNGKPIEASLMNKIVDSMPDFLKSDSAVSENNEIYMKLDVDGFERSLVDLGRKAGIAKLYLDEDYEDYRKNLIKDYKKAFDDNGNPIKGKIDAIRIELRNTYIKSELDSINGDYGSKLNNNFYQSMTTYAKDYDDMWDQLHTHLSGIRNSNGQVGYIWDDLTKAKGQADLKKLVSDMPKPKFLNETAEIVCNQLRIMEGSGGNPIKVGLNGGEAKQNSGLNYLDNNIEADFEPARMTARELLRKYDGDEMISRCKMVKPGVPWSYDHSTGWELVSVESQVDWLSDPANRDVEVQFFDPEDNPHGVYDTNTPASFNPEYQYYKRLPGICARIVDASQEAMVLKSKKKFAANATIVNTVNRGRYDRKGVGRRAVDFRDAERTRVKMLENYKKFIREYADDLVNGDTKEDWGKTLGFGMEQARIFAQGTVIGWKVQVKAADGSTQYVTIDAGDLFRPARFEERIGAINELGQIRFAELQTVSIKEISYRIHNGIVEESSNQDGRDLDTDETRRIAYEMATNWSDYSYDNLSLDEVFGEIPSIGMFRRGGLLASDSRTATQSFINAMWGRDESHFRKTDRSHVRARYFDSMKDSALMNKINHVNGFRGLDNSSNMVVMKSFMPENEAVMGTTRQFYDLLNSISDTENIIYSKEGDPRYGVAVVFDPNKLEDAVKWGYETAQAVLIDSSIYGSLPEEMRGVVTGTTSMNVNSGTELTVKHSQRTFYKLDVTKAHWIGQRLDLESPSMLQDTKKITRILMDEDGTYGLADASMVLRPEVMNNLVVPKADFKTIDTRKFFPHSTGPTRVMTVQELNELKDRLTSTPVKSWKSLGMDVHKLQKEWRFGDEEYARRVLEYIDSAISANNHRLPSAVESGQVVGIVADGTGRGERYLPVIVPNSAPNRCEWHNIELVGSNAIVQWYGNPTAGYMNIAGYSKYTLDKEAMKNIAEMAEGIPDGVDGIANYMTEKGRVEGREKILMINSMFWDMQELGGHLLYERDNNGAYKWVDGIPVECRDATSRNMNSTNNIWKQILGGDFSTLTDAGIKLDENDKRAIRVVVKQCDRLSINPMFVFGHASLTKGGKPYALVHSPMIDGVFGTLNEDQVLRVFNLIGHGNQNGSNQVFCPHGLDDSSNANNTRWDAFGRMKMTVNGNTGYRVVRVGPNDVMGHMSEVEPVGGIASWSPQHMYRRAADSGVIDENMHRTLQYSQFLTGNYRFLDEKKRLVDRAVSEDEMNNLFTREAKWDADALYTNTYLEVRENEIIGRTLNDTMEKPRIVYDGDEDLANPLSHHGINNAYKDLCKALGYNPSWKMTMQMAALQDGYSYGNGESVRIGANSLVNTLKQMTRNQEQYGTPLYNPNGSRAISGRIAIPLMPREMARYHYESSGSAKRHFRTYDDFRDFMYNAMDEAEVIINALPYNETKRKKALRRLGEAINRENNRTSHFGYVYGGVWADEIINSDGQLGMMLKGTDFDLDSYNELKQRAQEQMQDMRDRAQKYLRQRNIEVGTEFSGQIPGIKSNDGQVIANVLNNMTELTKMMALLNPAVTVSNMLDRTIHQGIMKASLHLCHKLHIGPHNGEHWLNQDIVKAAANNPLLIKMYTAYRSAGFTGDEIQFLTHAKSVEQINEYMDNKLANMRPFEKAATKVFDLGSGGNFRIKGQIENFINQFVMFAEVTPGLEFWFAEDPQAKADPNIDKAPMFIEAALANDPAKWFVDILGGNSGMSASLTPALQALNAAKGGDMAQRNCAAEILTSLAKRTSLGNFLFTSTISRFPNYAFNVTHRMLNMILPMSSIYYVFTEYAAKIESAHAERTGRPSLHLENTQMHRNLKQALLVDMCKMGTGAVAMILIGVSGMFEPPDDEDKWGNVDEWLLFGNRIGESWWMQDILGIALPYAAFVKSTMLGKPNINLLVNGTTQACYSNPIIRISDAVGFLCEPEGNFFTDYEIDKLSYQNAQGGPPSFWDYVQSNFVGFGLNWMSQFITPSVVKEWYNNAQLYEHSYKKVYKETGTGVLTEEGEYGETMNTTYGDAMIRRATRRNPILGWLCDMVVHPTTGYMAHEMPYTIYTDDYQRESKDYWSVAGLDDDAVEAKCWEIIAYMQQFKTTEDMKETGFYLDYETKVALSETVWDIYHTYEYEWQKMGANGELDYTLLGNGDFDAGKALFYELQHSKDEQKQYWYDFYYDRIKNSYLSDPMLTYRRYNTTYATDDKGEVYATGFRPQGLLPFISAPGNINDPEGTAGYKNDWVSLSAATNLPMEGKRALVPTPETYGEWPDIDSWSADGSGDQYSKRGQNKNGDSGSLKKVSGGSSGYGNASGSTGGSSIRSSSRRSGGGGGGGGRRSGGGGGGGSSSPNIYARATSPNMSAPRISDRVNIDRANLDYLRPGFETKGSREAYRREDI